jgi:molybdopterin molybdotransferase
MALSFADGLALVARRCHPVQEREIITLEEAASRILAEDIAAPIDYPPSDNSAVDGYAFRQGDLATSGGFRLVGVSAAGRPFAGQIGPGEGVRIFTGAVLPQGADTIAMQEHVVREGDRVVVQGDVGLAAHIRRAAEDIKAGSRVLKAGQRLGPAQIGLLASLGISQITAYRRLRIAVISSGDELLSAGMPPRYGSIYESNRSTLLALLSGLGAIATDFGILPDRESVLRSALVEAADRHDAVLTSAGASVGDEDHLRNALAAVGGVDFAGLAIRPGKPIVLGHIGETPIFGLPGNPVAMMTGFIMIARPGLFRLAGAESFRPRRFPVRANFSLTRKAGQREFLRGLLCEDAAGLTVSPFPHSHAGSIATLAHSDGLIEIAEDVSSITPGMPVPFLPFGLVGL